MSTQVLIHNARVFTMDPAIGDLDRGDVLVEDGRIAAVRPSTRNGQEDRPVGLEVVDGTDLIVAPGFVDTHRHTWQSAMRHTYADLDPMQYFAQVLGRIGPSYEADDVRIGNLLGAVCALSAGTTTMVDWSHIQNTPEHSDAAIEGLRSAGVRGVFAHGWPLVNDGSWTVASRLGHPQDIRRVREQYFASDDQLLTLAMAARGPEEAAPDVAFDDLRLARELGIRTTVHAGAYARNNDHHAVAQYAAAGLLSDDMTFVHCNRLYPEELRMIADTGGSVSLGAHCEMNSAGIGDIPLDKLLAIGLRPSLSGDTETKCTADMFTQMKMIFAHYRSWTGGGHSQVAEPVRLRLRDVLEFATVQGARAVGMQSRIGSLTAGKQADLICVRATDPNLGPVLDPVAALVLAAHEGNVDSVMVAGEFVKREGRMTRIDTRKVVEEAQGSQDRISARALARG
jgi:cytosine/adenosine deaminase-related metal-dependent hydrolase